MDNKLVVVRDHHAYLQHVQSLIRPNQHGEVGASR